MKLLMTVIIGYLVIHHTDSQEREDPQRGDVRLVGGSSLNEGRVEIYFESYGWGTVCHENWGITDADVVCKQLGYVWAVAAKTHAYYGEGSGLIYLNNVECYGNEDALYDCEPFGITDLSNNNCLHSDDAGVVCETDNLEAEDGLLRLTGDEAYGPSGLLYIMYNGVWGSVCPDDFNMNDANVACRQLGFAWAVGVQGGNDYSTCWTFITDVECDGTESSLLECGHEGLYKQNCDDTVKIACSDGDRDLDEFPKYLPVRLRDGKDDYSGRVEIYTEGEWGTICDQLWDNNDAEVVCRQLGYVGALEAKINGFYGSGSGPVHLKNVECEGNENYLSACTFNYDSDSDNCYQSNNAGVVCDDNDDDYSFSNSEYPSQWSVSTGGCDPDPCVNGYCYFTSYYTFCTCYSGWTGVYCETGISVVSACDTSPCVNGVCLTASISTYTCTCNSGWTGFNCDIVVNACDSSPCVNGLCLSRTSSSTSTYTCTCNSGWTGTNCDILVRACDSSPCVNGLCLSSSSSTSTYTCTCNSGWTGTNCDVVVSACDSSPCVNGFCLSTSSTSTYTCNCNSGWTGFNCDIEMTACDSNPCINGNCLLDTSSDDYHCTCYDGYTGDICDQEIVGCGLAPCLNGGQCKSVSDDGQYICDCLYAWIGTHCETERNGCNLYPCLNNGDCADIATGGYECTCIEGYSGDNCEIAETACDNYPCQNGECLIVPTDNTYFCKCDDGWTGQHCEEQVNLELECSSNPCLHGECLELSDEGYYCSCEDDWTGVNCQTSTIGCVAGPCLNGGVCSDIGSNGDYECDCPEGFDGQDCQTVENSCDPDPCINGECLDIQSSMTFYCVCDESWTGTLCDKEIACLNNPCMNAVTCIDLSNGEYRCICQTGWIGDICDEFESDHTNSMETTSNIVGLQTTEPVAAGPDQQTSSDLPIGIIAGGVGAAAVIIIALIVTIWLIRNNTHSLPNLDSKGVENQTYELDDSKTPIDDRKYDNCIQKVYPPEVKPKPTGSETYNEYMEPSDNLYADLQESNYAEIPDTYAELTSPTKT